jgi:predicted phage tail protein
MASSPVRVASADGPAAVQAAVAALAMAVGMPMALGGLNQILLKRAAGEGRCSCVGRGRARCSDAE